MIHVQDKQVYTYLLIFEPDKTTEELTSASLLDHEGLINLELWRMGIRVSQNKAEVKKAASTAKESFRAMCFLMG